MKPNFALFLSVEGIRLLHRVTGGWHLVGEVALDSEDMGGELAQIRQTALALEPSGIRTKVLLPNDQIKYFALDGTRAETAEIEAALDGTTPYTLDELVYDFSKGGGRTYVAAVAQETIEEAESFAKSYHFNPVCFAAIPDEFTFLGEPFFGGAGAAGGISASIERDEEAIKIIGHAHLPEVPKLLDEAPTSIEPQGDAENAEVAEFVQEEVEEVTEAETPAPEPLAPQIEEDILQGDLFPRFEETSAPSPEAAPAAELTPEPEPEVVFSSRAKPAVKAPGEIKMPPLAAPPVATEIDGRVEPTFASRTRSAAPKIEQGATSVSAPAAPPKLSAEPEFGQPAPIKVRGNEPSPSAAPRIAAAVEAVSAPAAPKPALKVPSLPKLGIGAFLKGVLSKPKTRKKEQAATPKTEAEAEIEQLTVFGSRKAQRGKPRFLALILTALLLLFLAAVAAWASYSDDALARWIRGESATVQFAQETEVLPVPEISEEEEFDIATAAADMAGDPAVAAVETTDVQDPEPSALEQPVEVGTPLSPAEAERIYAATGVWLRAPRMAYLPQTESSDDVVIPAIDPVTIGTDAIALPATFAPDRPILAPTNPPAPGTSFPRDENGFILATPEGTVMPDGVLVFARKPDVIPPLRPATLETDTSASADTAVAEAPNPLAGFRPRERPATLAEKIEREALGGFTNDELASLRPKVRPEGLVPPARQPDPNVDDAVASAIANAPTNDVAAIAAAIATAAPPPSSLNNATSAAVAASVRPDTRPRNFANIVQAARSAPAVAVAPAAVVAPSGPSPRSVASAATQDGALNLREMNLIGVSGTSNRRTAIVRMSNGRFLRVGVGDGIDGGQVTAIGESALNYVKNGRTYSLQMP